MAGVALVKTSKYNGKYVALTNMKDRRVIASAKTAETAYNKAVKEGYPDPLMAYIPKKNEVHIY
jgi:hypothetical protein